MKVQARRVLVKGPSFDDIAYAPNITAQHPHTLRPSISFRFKKMTSIMQQRLVCLRCVRRLRASTIRWNSTEATQDPPLLGSMRSDLKAAMRSKDKTKLNVLRAIIAEATNAAKTSTPIKDNMQMLALLRKKRAASKAAAAEFLENKREDLSQKQEEEIAVLDQYTNQVKVMSEEETAKYVDEAIASIKTGEGKMNAGAVLKELLKSGGSLEGKPVDKSVVAKLVKQRLEAA